MERVQKRCILADLHHKMVFLEGPRGVGKRTIAQSIATSFQSSLFLLYSNQDDRKIILDIDRYPNVELFILSEIHKMPSWRDFLNKIYKAKKPHQKFLILCNEKQDGYNLATDALHRLLPLTPLECEDVKTSYSIDHFLERGGFPEPLLAGDSAFANSWRLQYIENFLKSDMPPFENIHTSKPMLHTLELLKERVGAPISYASLGEAVGIAPSTVKSYIEIFEANYMIFQVTPYSHKIARSLLKEPKIYFYDIPLVKGNKGARFENLIALSLLKHTYFQIDTQSLNYSLHYLRAKDGKEVDFALLHDNTIVRAIEVKHSDSGIHPALSYFNQKHNLPCCQVTKKLKHEKSINNISILKAATFLKSLAL